MDMEDFEAEFKDHEKPSSELLGVPLPTETEAFNVFKAMAGQLIVTHDFEKTRSLIKQSPATMNVVTEISSLIAKNPTFDEGSFGLGMLSGLEFMAQLAEVRRQENND